MSTHKLRPCRESHAGGIALLGLTRTNALAVADSYGNSPWRTVTDEAWRSRLPAEAYDAETRRHRARLDEPATERASRWRFPLPRLRSAPFKSQWKLNCGTGWPSFYMALAGSLGKKSDFAIGAERTEYHCARCLGRRATCSTTGPGQRLALLQRWRRLELHVRLSDQAAKAPVRTEPSQNCPGHLPAP